MPSQLDRTREFVERMLCELQGSDVSPLTETVLIRKGHYCGHRFSTETHMAVWFFEEDEIKIYDQSRKLLRVENCLETQAIPLRRAA